MFAFKFERRGLYTTIKTFAKRSFQNLSILFQQRNRAQRKSACRYFIGQLMYWHFYCWELEEL